MAFQRRSWIAERAGWAGMALVVAAALLGLFAVGPLSWTSQADASGQIRVSYDRILRQTAQTTLRVDVQAAAIRGGEVELRLDGAFLRAFKLDRIVPTPLAETATGHGVRLRFRADPAGGGATITFALRPEAIGINVAGIGLPGVEPVRLPVFIHP